MFFFKSNLNFIKYIFFLQILYCNSLYSTDNDFKANPETDSFSSTTPSLEYSKNFMIVTADERASARQDRTQENQNFFGGSGEDVSIFDLAHKISKIVGYEGTIEWDTSKPNGTPKRPLDYSKISSLGWKSNYKLDEGLRKSYEWFKKNYE